MTAGLDADTLDAVRTLTAGALHEWRAARDALVATADPAERAVHLRTLDVLRLVLALFAAVTEGAVTPDEMEARIGQVQSIRRPAQRDALLRWIEHRRGRLPDVDRLDREIAALVARHVARSSPQP